MKITKNNINPGWCTGTLACLVILITMFGLANGQVVLVQSRLRSSRPASKSKSKPRLKPAATPEPVTEAPPPAQAAPMMLSFALIPPSLKNEVVTNPVKPLLWPELLGYEFDVIKTDDHGRERERRRERARFYLEGLNGGVNLEMVEIPAGMFLMGSDDAQLEQAEINHMRNLAKDNKLEINARLRSETPQRMVKVTGFFLSKYEVTQAQWRAVASLPKINLELMSDPSQFKGGNRPVEQISWDEAMEFCERLSRATGRRYRLPTEAEWEYAARAGTSWPFSFGETVSPELVNYNSKLPYGQVSKDSPRQQTVAVGSLGVGNAFGLYDMHGNVWEWCLDSWHDSYLGAPTESTVWEKDGVAGMHILRGGSWDSSAGECRSSGRRQSVASPRSNNIGFRVVAEVDVTVASK
jgi:formylglycine-generating enzyme required for sulfatase activity